jgi:hypothetical protein
LINYKRLNAIQSTKISRLTEAALSRISYALSPLPKNDLRLSREFLEWADIYFCLSLPWSSQIGSEIKDLRLPEYIVEPKDGSSGTGACHIR